MIGWEEQRERAARQKEFAPIFFWTQQQRSKGNSLVPGPCNRARRPVAVWLIASDGGRFLDKLANGFTFGVELPVEHVQHVAIFAGGIGENQRGQD